jgi:hypothetical protein
MHTNDAYTYDTPLPHHALQDFRIMFSSDPSNSIPVSVLGMYHNNRHIYNAFTH